MVKQAREPLKGLAMPHDETIKSTSSKISR
jgi:hypothetical protein